jgi:murein tripeptide amidase MpaA
MDYNRYLNFDELTERIRAVADGYPHLARLENAGQSFEGRPIWALVLTASSTGPDQEKPGMYIEGNIHAGEVTASMVCLYTAEHLVRNYGQCSEVTHLLNSRSFYILPRVNPDGAEKYLTTPYTLRSSVRLYPGPEVSELPGLHPEDINGDGHILLMRVRDDRRGEWALSRRDARIMVRRRPGERNGPYYRIYPEGKIKDFKGEPFDIVRTPHGLDLNRNFPSNWDRSFEPGGQFPTSEPEVHNVVKFIVGRKNIGCIQSFHTSGGFFFRNPYQYEEDKMDQEDLRAMKEIAREGLMVTGYPDVKSNNRSTLPEWAYEHLGLIGYTSELWDRLGRAGLNSVEAMKVTDPEKLEDMQIKLLEWNERELYGKGFFAWTAFTHPQLGEVEIGGWEPKFVVQNPPLHLLAQECHKNALWALRHAAALPELEIGDHNVEQIGPEVFKITVSFHNNGYLPTCITNKGRQVAGLKLDAAEIRGGLSVLGGRERVELGFLQGYMNAGTGYLHSPGAPAKSTAKISWTVKTQSKALEVVLTSQRAGTARKTITLL